MRNFVLLLFLLTSVASFGQLKFTFSGSISDASTGEDLIGATVYVEPLKIGALSNTFGFYSLSLKPGDYTVTYSFLGYDSKKINITITKDLKQNIRLNPKSQQLDEVVVSTQAKNQNILSNEMGTVKMSPQTIKAIPVLFGEQDILKTIQLMPGIASAGEGSTGYFVRGGQADQNLVLLDDAPVFNPSHLLGFFSVFNSDAINDIKMYKGGVPANFGGRASSVLDVHMREGNNNRYSAEGGIGLISSRLTVEGPLGKGGSSFLISGRRTYADLFLLLSKNQTLSGSKLYFYDLNLKTHFDLGNNDRIFISGYFGRDVLKTGMFGFDWGNKVGTLRWMHQFSPKFVSNTSVIYNDYDYKTSADMDFSFDLTAGIIGKDLKQKFTWYLNNQNEISFGLEANNYTFKPGTFNMTMPGSSNENFSLSAMEGLESAIYLTNDQKFGSRFSLEYGLRLSNFYRIGPSTQYIFDAAGTLTDSTIFSKNQWFNPYWNWEPRLSANFIINDKTSVKAGYNRISQYIHLLQNASAGTPVDCWIPSSPNVKPQIADQVSAGFFRNFKDNEYQLSVETYYKWMQNLIDYRTGASIMLNKLVEGELLYGKGKAYGMEFLFEKKEGKLTGWISYTLSRSLKQIEGINNSKWYPARQDRIHDLAVVAIYQLNPKWTFSANWVFYTGNAITFPVGKYYVDGKIANLYTERNGYRMPDYHRLDVGATWLIAQKRNYRSELNISVYNAYAQKNPYTYIFSEDRDNPGHTKTTMVYLFSAIPSITWNFKF
jgi:hypothetical protein